MQAGLTLLRAHSKLWFVVIQGLILPALFLYGMNTIYSVAHQNVETSEKRRIAALHTTIEYELNRSNPLFDVFTVVTKLDPTITDAKIVEKTQDVFTIIAAHEPEKIGMPVSEQDSFYSAYARQGETIIFELSIDNVRHWQTFRAIKPNKAGSEYVIYTEHSFSYIDSVFAKRAQASYVVLTLILVYIIATALWLVRQIDWRARSMQYEQQLSERDQFTHMIAHELRTPLTAIRGYASLLSESATLTPEQRSYAKSITQASNRLVQLVSDFLEVARLQTRKIKPTLSSVDIRSIIGEVVTELMPTAKEKSLELTARLPTLPICIVTDPDRLRQVLVNLVGNAVKYTDSGTISVSVTAHLEQLEIRIADTGRGITGPDQTKLFTPFSRVGDTRSVSGTGLGLWIARELVTLLGGTLTIESIAGVGTHSVLLFPREHSAGNDGIV
jgi:signal transduction histidine kinase